MIIHLLFLCSVLTSSGVIASGGDCSYEISEYNGYSCTLSFHDLKDSSSFTNIGGDHVEGKSDDDVLGVWIYTDVYNADVVPYLCNKFNNLEQLFFQSLVLSELPENSFSACKNLNSLTLRSKLFLRPQISKLPQNLLVENTKLTSFDASLKGLQSIPENFFTHNSKLNRISLSENKIRTLPANIFKTLVNLDDLILSKNDIHEINPAWFESLENLQILFLNDNHITDIPKGAFASLKNLKELWISFNNIKVIHSDSFSLHPKLVSINLMYNQISAIDEKFIDNIGVKYFQILSNNCVSQQFYDENGEKNALKEALKPCFENYQARVDVGERTDVQEPETTPSMSLFDQVDGEELLKNFLILFNQFKALAATPSTPSEN